MSLDAAQVEAAIRRNDAVAVRDLVKDATESDRRACAKSLKELIKGPGWPDDEPIFMWRLRPADAGDSQWPGQPSAEQLGELAERRRRYAEQRRAYEQWQAVASGLAFRLAVLGLAGGVEAAAKALGQLPDPLDHSEPHIDLAAAVLADRRPEWLADLLDRYLRWNGDWRLARQLVRLGAVPRPDVPEYTTLMPDSAARGKGHPDGTPEWAPTPAQALLADPGLLDDEVWRLFTVPDAAAALDRADRRISWLADMGEWPGQTWSEGLALLCAQGHLDRGRLADACLDAFSRDFNPNRVSWYSTMLVRLDLSVGEMAERAAKYLGLLASPSKAGVRLGQLGARTLLDAGRLDAGRLLDASAPALLSPQKGIAIAQLGLIDKVATLEPAAVARAVAAAAVAFGHQRQDVQEAALALIRKHGLPDGAPLAEIRLRAMDLSASLAAEAATLGLRADAGYRGEAQASDDDERAAEIAGLERRIAALPAARAAGLVTTVAAVRRGEVPGPAMTKPEPGAALPAPVTDPGELVQLLSALMEDARDAIAAERALAAAVSLSSLPERERRQAAGPLLKRAASVMNSYVPFNGDRITSDMALIAHVWAGEPLPALGHRDNNSWFRPGQYAVDGSGRAVTMAGIFSARAWEAAKLIESGQGGLLLAEPETERGTISPECLLDRVQRLARRRDGAGGSLAGPHDRDVALLRLAPGAPDSLWPAWSRLAGVRANAMRENYRLINAPLKFEPVTGLPRTKPAQEYRERDELLLARTTDQVPVAPGCPRWKLLTRLSDPLADYLMLTEVGRYERHYDDAVAGWALICPWQPEVAAAHLLRPLSAGLNSKSAPAITAISSLHPAGHSLGLAGHLALIAGLASLEADARIAAAELWLKASTDGRLDPALAATALVAAVTSQAVKVNRVAESLQHASHQPLAARRIVETVCYSVPGLVSAAPANLHLLIELAARLGTSVGVPELPDDVRTLAAKRRGSRLSVTAEQLLRASNGQPPDREHAAVQALAALVTRAESAR